MKRLMSEETAVWGIMALGIMCVVAWAIRVFLASPEIPPMDITGQEPISMYGRLDILLYAGLAIISVDSTYIYWMRTRKEARQ